MHGLHNLAHQDIKAVIEHMSTRTDKDDRSYKYALSEEQYEELKALAWYGSHQSTFDFDHHCEFIGFLMDYTISPSLLRSGLKRLRFEPKRTG